MKLPLEQRPNIKSIENRLTSRIDKKLLNLFVIDLQNDCDCEIEKYGFDYLDKVLILDNHNVRFHNDINLPMMNEICNQDIKNLLTEAFKYAKDTPGDTHYSKVIYNTNTQLSLETFNILDNICPLYQGRSGVSLNYFGLDFIEPGFAYIMPDEEFFGLVTANINKFGAFCFPENICKVKL